MTPLLSRNPLTFVTICQSLLTQSAQVSFFVQFEIERCCTYNAEQDFSKFSSTERLTISCNEAGHSSRSSSNQKSKTKITFSFWKNTHLFLKLNSFIFEK